MKRSLSTLLLLAGCGETTSTPSGEPYAPPQDTQPADAFLEDTPLSDTASEDSDIAPPSDTSEVSPETDTHLAEDSDSEDAPEPTLLDPEGDEDGDFVSNAQELLDGTNPYDPRSVRALQPELQGHPRLFVRPEDHARLLALSHQNEGPAAIVWARLTQFAQREAPAHPLEGGYQTGIPPQQARIAEAAATVGWIREDKALVDKALTLLAEPYPDPSPLNTQQFNSGEHYNLLEAEALVSYCTAYDLAAGSTLADLVLKAQAESRLTQRFDDFLRLCTQEGGCTRLLRNEKTNHTLKALAAIGVCALALPEHPQRIELFHEAFASTYVVAHDYQGNAEGGWAEGSNYLNYSGDTHLAWFAALKHLHIQRGQPDALWGIRGGSRLTPGVELSRTTHHLPAPHQAPLWQRVYQAALYAALPNGLLPPADDANPSALHGGILFHLFGEPSYLWNWALPSVGFASGRLTALSFLALDLEADAQAISPPWDHTLEEAGYTVWRSSLESDAHYLHVQHENGRMRTQGGAHEHADPLSFMLYAYGEPLAIDPGYLDYANHGLVKQGSDHNLILVEGSGPVFPLDGFVQAAPVGDAWSHASEIAPFHKALAASARYRFTEVRRRFIELSFAHSPLRILLTSELMVAETAQHYTYVLNGLASEHIPSTTFEANALSEVAAAARWQRPKASLNYIGGPSEGALTLSTRLEESVHAVANHRCIDVAAHMGEALPLAGFLSAVYALPGQTPALESEMVRPEVGLQVLTLTLNAEVEVRATLNLHAQPKTYLNQSYAPGLSVVVRDGQDTRSLHFAREMPAIPMPELDL